MEKRAVGHPTLLLIMQYFPCEAALPSLPRVQWVRAHQEVRPDPLVPQGHLLLWVLVLQVHPVASRQTINWRCHQCATPGHVVS